MNGHASYRPEIGQILNSRRVSHVGSHVVGGSNLKEESCKESCTMALWQAESPQGHRRDQGGRKESCQGRFSHLGGSKESKKSQKESKKSHVRVMSSPLLAQGGYNRVVTDALCNPAGAQGHLMSGLAAP